MILEGWGWGEYIISASLFVCSHIWATDVSPSLIWTPAPTYHVSVWDLPLLEPYVWNPFTVFHKFCAGPSRRNHFWHRPTNSSIQILLLIKPKEDLPNYPGKDPVLDFVKLLYRVSISRNGGTIEGEANPFDERSLFLYKQRCQITTTPGDLSVPITIR